jgi:UvrB/UvrC motif-containing protein
LLPAIENAVGTAATKLKAACDMIDKGTVRVRCLVAMSLDLNTILKDWPHENGNIKVRKIAGLDGREKLQLRVDLGVLQMELAGRPDGRRPHNCESLLEYHQRRAARAEAKGETYQLTPEQCAELQQEGIQYYHRYLSLFQINDFDGVVRDTQRNLDLFSFVSEHTDREEFSWSLQQFRPYVLMMNTRAKASILLGQGKFAEAIAEIERGREAIVDFLQQSNFPELVAKSSEIAFLDEWLEEVKAKRPLSKLEVMQREMQTAIAKELYERAAELRDAIRLLQTKKH